MPIALTPHETWEYQLEEDCAEKPERAPDGTLVKKGRPDPEGTWWPLRSVPAHVAAQIADSLELGTKNGEQVYHLNAGTVDRLYLEHGIAGAPRNWKDAKGRDVPFRMRTVNGREVADLAFLDYLEPRHRSELARAVASRTKVTIEESD